MLTQYIYDSEIGAIYIVASDKGIKGLYWKKQTAPMVKEPSESPQIAKAVKQLNEYFSGKRKDFDLPLDIAGTAFQKSVWNQLSKIPYGKTISYSDLAKKIKNDKAVRAVGTANGRNPMSIIIPCHRVIAADGKLGGYAGGLETKKKLLKLEGSSWKD